MMNVQQPVEQPMYVLPQTKKRALIPKIITLLVLGGIFYLGVLLNLTLLELSEETYSIVNLVSLILLLCVLVLGISLAVRKAEQDFKFYRTKLFQGKKFINYISILNINPKQDFLDKIFKTYSINLGNNFHLRHISQKIQIGTYLQKLINFNKQNQPTSYQNNFQQQRQ